MTSMMPAAFVGYAIHSQGLVIRCCAYCPDKNELDQWAEKKGTPVTHTICAPCANREIAKLTAETP